MRRMLESLWFRLPKRYRSQVRSVVRLSLSQLPFYPLSETIWRALPHAVQGSHTFHRLVGSKVACETTGQFHDSAIGLVSGRLSRGSLLQRELPALNWSIHADVVVRAHMTGFLSSTGLHVSPLTARSVQEHVLVRDGAYRKGPVEFGRAGAFVKRTAERECIAEGVFLGGFAPTAYFHHLTERLALLAHLSSLPQSLGDVPLLVPEESLKTQTFVEIMRLIAPNHQVFALSRSREYLVRRLIWLDAGIHWRNRSIAVHAASLRAFRIRLLDELGITATADPSLRLHIRRGSSRRTENEDELIEVSQSFGFCPWSPEGAPIAEQVRRWATAGFVIGDSGAAWTGLIYSPVNSHGLVFSPRNASTGWSGLAAVGGRTVFEHRVLSRRERRVNPEWLYRYLSQTAAPNELSGR